MRARVWCAVWAVAMVGCADRRDRGNVIPTTGDAGTVDAGTVGEADAGLDPEVDAAVDPPAGEEVLFDDDRVETSMIAVSPGGVPHVVFTPYEGLMHGTRGADGAWTIAPIPGAERARYAAIAAGPDESIHLLYVVDYELLWAQWRRGSWRTESVDPGMAVTGYALTVDAAGEPRVAYQIQQFEGGFTRDELWYAERAAGTWRWELVHAERWDVGRSASIAVDSAGTVGIVYCQDICYGDPDMAIKEAGGAWEHFPLPDTIGGSQTTVFIDAGDAVHLAWTDHVENTVMHAFLTEDGWAPLTVDPAFPNAGSRVQLLDGPDGGLHAFYGQRRASIAIDTAWTVTPLELEHTDGVRDVMAGADGAGDLHVSYAWRDGESLSGELRYLRIAPR